MFDPRNPDERQQYFLKKAAQLAFRSNLLQRHGCIIVQNDEIISTGYNHTYIHMYHKYSCHAEHDAIRKIKKATDLSTAEMYIVRIGPESLGNPLKLSKPCEGCTKLINKANIGTVFYSWGTIIPS
jgi:deoxycytidylate deaminase